MERGDGKNLRSGFTTGACAAAASKAALSYLLSGVAPVEVNIPFPSGDRHRFAVHRSSLSKNSDSAFASVIKDAGDDPDVTNGAEIGATVRLIEDNEADVPDDDSDDDNLQIVLMAGDGVGTVTRPGLAVPPGDPAINPGPRKMIRQAIEEVINSKRDRKTCIEITISVKNGQELSKQTLNSRLGIVGGLSILGTTGIVRPVSAKAWTDTIEASMSVAKAAGLDEIILSTGRTSERHVQELLGLPEEAMVMMGDYLQYALKASARHGFSHIHLAGMWAKILKAALEIPQTHVRNGALEVRQAAALLEKLGLGAADARKLSGANTAREIFDMLENADRRDLIRAVCQKAKQYAHNESGLPVTLYLVHSSRGVVEQV